MSLSLNPERTCEELHEAPEDTTTVVTVGPDGTEIYPSRGWSMELWALASNTKFSAPAGQGLDRPIFSSATHPILASLAIVNDYLTGTCRVDIPDVASDRASSEGAGGTKRTKTKLEDRNEREEI